MRVRNFDIRVPIILLTLRGNTYRQLKC